MAEMPNTDNVPAILQRLITGDRPSMGLTYARPTVRGQVQAAAQERAQAGLDYVPSPVQQSPVPRGPTPRGRARPQVFDEPPPEPSGGGDALLPPTQRVADRRGRDQGERPVLPEDTQTFRPQNMPAALQRLFNPVNSTGSGTSRGRPPRDPLLNDTYVPDVPFDPRAMPGVAPAALPEPGELDLPGTANASVPQGPIAPAARPSTPTETPPQAGLNVSPGGGSVLQAVADGQTPSVNPMSPEAFDPETGTRSHDMRSLSLLERMFGEEGSEEYTQGRRNMGRALLMAGAAIMSTNGDVGVAIGNGIQAGLMTYDQATQALRDEEREARQMGMEEEAHEINMALRRLQLQRAESGGGGARPSQTELDANMLTRAFSMAAAMEANGIPQARALELALGTVGVQTRGRGEDAMAGLNQ